MRRRHAHSYSIASVVGAARTDTSELRLAAGRRRPDGRALRTVEEPRNPDDVLKDVQPVDDAVASAAYRSAILPKLVRAALDRLESR